MKKSVYELRNNKRVQAIRGKGAAPRNRMIARTKNFSLRVRCAADFPHRISRFEDLNLELLQKGLYARIKPVNLFAGDFIVQEGFEDAFKEIAGDHGFAVSEVIEA